MKRSLSLRTRLIRRILSLMRDRFSTISVGQSRAMAKNVGFPLPKGTTVTQVSEISAQWVNVNNSPRSKVLLYLHGGGYVQNTPKIHHALVARLVVCAGVRALYVDYRLAPEYPFPVALDDTVAAYKWLLRQDTPAQKIIFAGDSAGGGLAIAAMLRLQEEKLVLPAAAVLLSPWCDLTMNGQSAIEDRDPIYSRQTFLSFGKLYASGVPLEHPLLAPLTATFKNMPPILIQAGELELLRDDAIRLASCLRDAGTAVQLSIYRGLWHVWQIYPSFMVPESQVAIDEIGKFLRAI